MTVGLEGRRDQVGASIRENFFASFRAFLFSLFAGVQRGSVPVLRPGEPLEVAQLSATVPIASQDCSSLPGVKGGRSPLRSNASAPLMPGGGVQTLGIGAGAGGAMNSKQTSDLYAIQSSFFCMSPRTGCLLTGCNPESKESRQCRTRST